MLPKTPDDYDYVAPTSTTTRTIYINPNFSKVTATTQTTAMTQSAHINPLFLRPPAASTASQQVPVPPPTIHMNPNFVHHQLLVERLQQQQQRQLTQKNSPQQQQRHVQQKLPTSTPAATIAPKTNISLAPVAANSCKIIEKSRMRIVRAAPLSERKPTAAAVSIRPLLVKQQPLIRLSHLKLVRRPIGTAASKATPPAALKTPKTAPTKIAVTAAATYSIATRGGSGKYKIDHRRCLPRSTQLGPAPLRRLVRRRTSFVARFALRRASDQAALSALVKRKVTTGAGASASANRKLQLLNINGVLYKSTRNKLQRKDVAAANIATRSSASSKPTSKLGAAAAPLAGGRTLFVRGTKFVLDAEGFRLTRIAVNSSDAAGSAAGSALRLHGAGAFKTPQRQRIDIGGLTYVASAATQNVYVRTRNHVALAHLNQAKQRSLQLLWRARLVKSNVPCAIFKRVGRCAAHERDRCSKVHDKLQVTICPRFLRSECDNDNCLLSHNVSLSKMPVCRFFLQGVCVRADCPYLHKKLSRTAEICEDFLRGFCRLADQCEKRHEFLCPEFERNGKCETANCSHCKSKKRRALEVSRNSEAKKRATTTEAARDSIKLPARTPSSTKNEASKKENTPAVRYFNGGNENGIKEMQTAPGVKIAGDISPHVSSASSSDDDEVATIATSSQRKLFRPKVGTLPAFIPLS